MMKTSVETRAEGGRSGLREGQKLIGGAISVSGPFAVPPSRSTTDQPQGGCPRTSSSKARRGQGHLCLSVRPKGRTCAFQRAFAIHPELSGESPCPTVQLAKRIHRCCKRLGLARHLPRGPSPSTPERPETTRGEPRKRRGAVGTHMCHPSTARWLATQSHAC